MATFTKQTNWGTRPISWWLTLILAAGIIYIGIRFMISPGRGAEGFGIPFRNEEDAIYGKIKGIRDIITGVVAIPLLLMRKRRETAWVFTTIILVPATDFMIILYTNGLQYTTHLLIHGCTVLVMIITSILLFKGK